MFTKNNLTIFVKTIRSFFYIIDSVNKNSKTSNSLLTNTKYPDMFIMAIKKRVSKKRFDYKNLLRITTFVYNKCSMKLFTSLLKLTILAVAGLQ